MPWLTLACLLTVALALVLVRSVTRDGSSRDLEGRYRTLRSARGLASLSVLLAMVIFMMAAFQLHTLSVDFRSWFAVATLGVACIPLATALPSWCATVVAMRGCVRLWQEQYASNFTASFSVEIKGRGEGLEYKDEDGTFVFEIRLSSRPMELHAYDCRDESFKPKVLTEAQRSRILPRIVTHMDPWQREVKVLTEAPEWDRRAMGLSDA